MQEHFDKLYGAVADAHGVRPRGIQHVHSLLRRALKYAVANKRLPTNPTDDADVAKTKAGPAQFLTAIRSSDSLAQRERIGSALCGSFSSTQVCGQAKRSR